MEIAGHVARPTPEAEEVFRRWIHLLDDEFARVHSHAHDPASYKKVRRMPTVIGDGARIASRAIVPAGQHVGDGEAVGSFPADRI